MEIYLIRHGESIMNTGENTRIGEIDSKIWLTEHGKKQAKDSAEFLRNYIDHTYCGSLYDFWKSARIWISPYERTRGTFDIFDKEIGFSKRGVKCLEDILLAEQEFGLFDSVSEDRWPECYPTEYTYYMKLKNNQGKFMQDVLWERAQKM